MSPHQGAVEDHVGNHTDTTVRRNVQFAAVQGLQDCATRLRSPSGRRSRGAGLLCGLDLVDGIDHRIDPHQLGMRDLTGAPSVRVATERAGVADGPVDVAELHTPYSHQELVVRREMGLDDATEVNPSGGALVANAVMAAGLVRIGELAERISSGRAGRGVAHATSGPCLQQNLVCVLEGDRGR